MKIISCAAVLLLCASSVTALNVIIKCGGLLGNTCPSGYKLQYHGKNMLNSECVCVRRETPEEEATRRHKERPERCTSAIEGCQTFGADAKNRLGGHNDCEIAMEQCDLQSMHSLCAKLKKDNRRWECRKSKAYKERTYVPPETDATKICAKAKGECLDKGEKFPNWDRDSLPCESYIEHCPKEEVISFCKTHNNEVGSRFRCEYSIAYKGRKEVQIPEVEVRR